MAEGHFVGVANTERSSYVYVGCPDRAEFDKIKAEAKDHGRNEHGDHVITKSVEQGSVVVIFQHWISREPVDSYIARKRAEREAAVDTHRQGAE